MITENDIGKMVAKIGCVDLRGKLLGFDEKGRAKVKRPNCIWHADSSILEISDLPTPIYVNPYEAIEKLKEIIIDEFPKDDPRRVYAESLDF